MGPCSFKKLVNFLDKRLDLDGKLEILNHLELCDICRETVYQISRDRDEALFICRPFSQEANLS